MPNNKPYLKPSPPKQPSKSRVPAVYHLNRQNPKPLPPATAPQQASLQSARPASPPRSASPAPAPSRRRGVVASPNNSGKSIKGRIHQVHRQLLKGRRLEFPLSSAYRLCTISLYRDSWRFVLGLWRNVDWELWVS